MTALSPINPAANGSVASMNRMRHAPTLGYSESEHPFAWACEEWLKKIKHGEDAKEEAFGKYAREAADFFDGPAKSMWEGNGDADTGWLSKKSFGSNSKPMFRVTINKPFEAVALFGPALMHQYPQVLVTASNPPVLPPELFGMSQFDPNSMQQYQMLQMQEESQKAVRSGHAAIKQHYLNWLQVEAGKKSHARRSITEAIVKGLGILWTDMYQPRGSRIKYPRSVHVSVDDIVKDPDARYNEDVQWIARKCIHPVNIVEREHKLPVGTIQGHLQSKASQANKRSAKDAQRGEGDTFDLIEYWKIYSKNGFGSRLKTTNQANSSKSKFDYDQWGDFCYLVVAKGVPFPLNMPSWSVLEGADALFQRSQWPIPYWTDDSCGNGWPISELHFYEQLNCVWPMSLIKPCIGELKFINWCLSFLADKVAASCTSYLGILKGAGAEIQKQLDNGSAPFKTIEIAEIFGKSINDVVSFIKSPDFSRDIWTMISEVMSIIDRRTGLTELIYGLTGTQMRSATEADARQGNLSIRPDDMAQRTEDFYSASCMKEMEAACWNLTGEDVAPVLGQTGAMIWEQQIMTKDFDTVVRDFQYRLEAGSARKPNQANRTKALNEFGQFALPVISEMVMAGNVEPWNAYVRDMGKALDGLIDAEKYMIQPPDPNNQPPSPEEQKAQVEMQLEQMRFELEKMKAELDLQMSAEQHDQDMAQSNAEFYQEMAQDQAKSQQDLRLEKEQGRVKIQLAKAQARAKPKPTSQGSKK